MDSFSKLVDAGLGGSQSQSTPQPTQKKHVATLRSLLSHSILQAIQDKPDDPLEELEIDGKEVNHVTMVGKIMAVSPEKTNTRLKILDDSGEMQVKVWRQDGDEERMADLVEGRYVRMYGSLKKDKGEVLLVAFSVQPVKDYNEVTHHTLEVIRQHLVLKKCPADDKSSQENAMGLYSMLGTPHPNRRSQPIHSTPLSARSLSPMSTDSTPKPAAHSTILLERVKEVFKGDSSETGLHFDEVLEKLEGRFPSSDVKKTLDWLINEGNIYTTTTENHYQWCA